MKIPNLWSFMDADVARGFDEHVREQLPWYELVTKAAGFLARGFLSDGARAYEIGAATGNFGKSIAEVISTRRVDYIGIEASALMTTNYAGPGKLILADAREISYKPFDLGISFLTLVFIPKCDRGPLLRSLVDSLKTGGGLIIVERFEPIGGSEGLAISRLNIAMKVDAGVGATAIVDKELSLQGAQFPLDPWELRIERTKRTLFFKLGDFEGWLLQKE